MIISDKVLHQVNGEDTTVEGLTNQMIEESLKHDIKIEKQIRKAEHLNIRNKFPS